MISTPTYLRTYLDHPVENVALANQLRTALQGLPGVTRAPVPPTLREPVYDFDVASIDGPMVMSVRPHLTDEGVMFACQFQDPSRAAKHLGSTWGLHRLNPYSGKWNHYHAFNMNPAFALRSFLPELLPILPLDRLVTHVYQDHDRSQIHAAFHGTEWTATIAGLGGPSFNFAASLFRLEPRPKDHPLRFSEVTRDRAELARVLTGAMFLDMQRVLLREALLALPTSQESP